MKIAITNENNSVFQHFGHTPGFALYEVAEGKIISRQDVSSGESGHGALAGVLAAEKVDVLICGGIGGGAITALGNAGIRVVGGASGDVDEVARKFVEGNLEVRADYHCNHHHHDEGHACGSQGCGSGTCSH